MDDLAIARVLHVLSLMHWIGGVSIVTTIVLPRARALTEATAALVAFEDFEGSFVKQARISILLAGASGTYMLYATSGWSRLWDPGSWWIGLMVMVWTIFAVMVFVLEPLLVHRVFRKSVARDKNRAFTLMIHLHALALTASVGTIVAGLLGARGALP
jgi:uncharacterized membrane protein